jgi:hypothetical protein
MACFRAVAMPIGRIARGRRSTRARSSSCCSPNIDHSGLLPRLAQQGFRGPIYTTAATCDLLEVMLLDAAYLQEREAERGMRASGRFVPCIP